MKGRILGERRSISRLGFRIISWIVLFLIPTAWALCQTDPVNFSVEPGLILKDIHFTLKIKALDSADNLMRDFEREAQIHGVYVYKEGKRRQLRKIGPFKEGVCILRDVYAFADQITVKYGDLIHVHKFRVIPAGLSLLPAITAIALAIITRQVLVALFCGVWLGALFIYGFNPLLALVRSFDTYLVDSVSDLDHARILIFTLALGGLIGVITKGGGTKGMVELVSRIVKRVRGGQVATWAMGIFIFFDDYANCLIVGNTLRPLTDRLRISREKLSYIVDSTAAPIATVAIISTWIGFQLGRISDGFQIAGVQESAYATFLSMIPYSFYSLFALFFVLLVSVTTRDFGPMYRAELRARGGKVLRDGARPLMDRELTELLPGSVKVRWFNGLIPIISMILITVLGLYLSGVSVVGADASLRDIVGAADSYNCLLWASFGASLVAGILVLSQRVLSLEQTIGSWVSGAKSMILALFILVLAWSIGMICKELMTANFVVEHVTKAGVPSWLFPTIIFVTAALIAFATGTSFGTMTILMPIVIPVVFSAKLAEGIDPGMMESIRYSSLAGVLSGAIFGDHCSPISDTTIMSSIASGADHIDHVNTQLPYGILCAGVACLVGFLPAGYGVTPLITLPLGFGLLILVLFIFGRKV